MARAADTCLLPPGYDGELSLSPGEFVETVRPRTYNVWLVLRAFMGADGDPAPGFATLGQTGIYPLPQRR